MAVPQFLLRMDLAELGELREWLERQLDAYEDDPGYRRSLRRRLTNARHAIAIKKQRLFVV